MILRQGLSKKTQKDIIKDRVTHRPPISDDEHCEISSKSVKFEC